MNSIESVLEQYRNAANLHGKALQDGDKKTANKQYAVLKKLYQFIQKENIESETLQELINDENIHVQAWAAAHCLSLNIHVEKSTQILETLSKRSDIGIARLNAEMILESWKNKGILKY